ncbi:endo-1,4-beta-xylanase [Termitidicoccus mucosus]|uniref:Beta-xylanase n=1 Tax=Termitidicoccus mucosus TaxID=1184151 RepID=A0A178IBN6_9BACT|nr:hypothetical protein AW736_23025 [Opitutaceae bacterium TSB47]
MSHPLFPSPLPPGEPLVEGGPLAAFKLVTGPEYADAAGFSTIETDGPGFSRAWRVETKRDTAPSSAIGLRALTGRAVAEGDTGLLRFFARTVSSADETGAGRVFIVVSDSGLAFNSSFELGVSFGREWREFVLPFRFHKDFPREGAAVMFHFGFMRQTVEIGGLDVLYYGKTQTLDSLPRTRFTYAGREDGAAWRADALARIERIRKGAFNLRVTDAAGRPVSDASIRIEQTRQAFQFGTALQFARLVHDTPDNLRYRELTLELFNAASPENDLKWGAWSGDWGDRYSPAQSLAGLRWLRGHGIPVRGHVLVWPGWKNLPRLVQELRGTPRQDEIPRVIREHIRTMARDTRGLLEEWDALNEPFTNHDLMDLFGPEIMADWFKTAAAAMPGVPLYLNDFSNHDLTTDADHVRHFEETARFLVERGAPLGGLGVQAHIGSQPNAPAEVLKVLDRYAAFNLPVRITEFDVWTDDEQLQADYTRDFFILCFSHPSVVGIQLWGFWEACHWRPQAAMFRTDWSEKPNAAVYRSLVLDQWRTRIEARTDAGGCHAARGFHGDYLVTVESGGRRAEKAFALKPGEPALNIEIVLP